MGRMGRTPAATPIEEPHGETPEEDLEDRNDDIEREQGAELGAAEHEDVTPTPSPRRAEVGPSYRLHRIASTGIRSTMRPPRTP